MTVWRRVVVGDGKSWVVFRHGTCVVLPAPRPRADLAAAAVRILRRYGPVQAGTPAGDFEVVTLDPGPGWVVLGHHPDVLNYVDPGEVSDGDDAFVGLLGRAGRDRDGRELEVAHVEDRRA